MFRRSPSLKILIFAVFGFIFHKFVGFSLFGLVSFSIHFFVILLAISLIFKSKFPVFFFFAFIFGIFTSLRTQHLDYTITGKCDNINNGYFYANVSKVLKTQKNFSRLIVEGKILNDDWKLIKNTRFLLTIINYSNYKGKKIDDNDIVAGAIQYRIPFKATLPNEFNELNYLRNIDCEYTATGLAKKVGIISVNRPPVVRDVVKKSIFNRIDDLYSNSTRGIVKAILLGDKSELHRDIRKEFAVTGVAHILAVSGFHVGVIAGILFWIFSFIRNNYIKFILITLSLVAYVYLVDFQPSAVRAGIMIVLFLFAYLLQRKPNPINIIATTVLLVAVVNPSSLYSAGFQMSVAAISGIFLLYSPFRNFLFNYLKFEKIDISKKIGSSLAVSLAASVVVSPIIAYYFGIYSIISPLANLVVIPFMLFGQIFGIVALASSYLFLPLGHIFANTSQLSIEIATLITHYAAELPFSHISGDLVYIVSIFTSVFLIYLLLSNSLKQLVFRLIAILFFSSLLFGKYFLEAKPSFIIYERANSYLIENKLNNRIILIGKKDCTKNWDDYGLTNYLKFKKSKLLLFNIPDRMRYNLYRNKIRYKKINNINLISKELETIKRQL